MTHHGFQNLVYAVGTTLLQYCSSRTLIAIEKSNVLGNAEVTDTMRLTAYTNEHDLHERVQHFISTNSIPPDCVDGIFVSAFHLWNLNITKLHSESIDDKLMKETILLRLKNTQNTAITVPDTNAINDIIDHHMKQFNQYLNQTKEENKELCCIYYVLFHECAPREWSSGIDGKENYSRDFFKDYGFNNCSKGIQNGKHIDIELDFEDIKAFWIQLFVEIFLQFGTHHSIQHIKAKSGMPKEFSVDKIDSLKNVEKMYYTIFNKNKGTDGYIGNVMKDVLLEGFVQFEAFYLCKAFWLMCYGNPVGMARGEQHLVAKLKSPKKGKLTFWCWTLKYDDLW